MPGIFFMRGTVPLVQSIRFSADWNKIRAKLAARRFRGESRLERGKSRLSSRLWKRKVETGKIRYAAGGEERSLKDFTHFPQVYVSVAARKLR
ncbi:MAG: hypothetical protein ACTTKL_11665 [Treponema sp.]